MARQQKIDREDNHDCGIMGPGPKPNKRARKDKIEIEREDRNRNRGRERKRTKRKSLAWPCARFGAHQRLLVAGSRLQPDKKTGGLLFEHVHIHMHIHINIHIHIHVHIHLHIHMHMHMHMHIHMHTCVLRGMFFLVRRFPTCFIGAWRVRG